MWADGTSALEISPPGLWSDPLPYLYLPKSSHDQLDMLVPGGPNIKEDEVQLRRALSLAQWDALVVFHLRDADNKDDDKDLPSGSPLQT